MTVAASERTVFSYTSNGDFKVTIPLRIFNSESIEIYLNDYKIENADPATWAVDNIKSVRPFSFDLTFLNSSIYTIKGLASAPGQAVNFLTDGGIAFELTSNENNEFILPSDYAYPGVTVAFEASADDWEVIFKIKFEENEVIFIGNPTWTNKPAALGPLVVLTNKTVTPVKHDQILIRRELPIERLVDYEVKGHISADSYNLSQDKEVLMLQDIQTDVVKYSIRYAQKDINEIGDEGACIVAPVTWTNKPEDLGPVEVSATTTDFTLSGLATAAGEEIFCVANGVTSLHTSDSNKEFTGTLSSFGLSYDETSEMIITSPAGWTVTIKIRISCTKVNLPIPTHGTGIRSLSWNPDGFWVFDPSTPSAILSDLAQNGSYSTAGANMIGFWDGVEGTNVQQGTVSKFDLAGPSGCNMIGYNKSGVLITVQQELISLEAAITALEEDCNCPGTGAPSLSGTPSWTNKPAALGPITISGDDDSIEIGGLAVGGGEDVKFEFHENSECACDGYEPVCIVGDPVWTTEPAGFGPLTVTSTGDPVTNVTISGFGTSNDSVSLLTEDGKSADLTLIGGNLKFDPRDLYSVGTTTETDISAHPEASIVGSPAWTNKPAEFGTLAVESTGSPISSVSISGFGTSNETIFLTAAGTTTSETLSSGKLIFDPTTIYTAGTTTFTSLSAGPTESASIVGAPVWTDKPAGFGTLAVTFSGNPITSITISGFGTSNENVTLLTEDGHSASLTLSAGNLIFDPDGLFSEGDPVETQVSGTGWNVVFNFQISSVSGWTVTYDFLLSNTPPWSVVYNFLLSCSTTTLTLTSGLDGKFFASTKSFSLPGTTEVKASAADWEVIFDATQSDEEVCIIGQVNWPDKPAGMGPLVPSIDGANIKITGFGTSDASVFYTIDGVTTSTDLVSGALLFPSTQIAAGDQEEVNISSTETGSLTFSLRHSCL